MTTLVVLTGQDANKFHEFKSHQTFSLLIDALLRKNKVLYAAFINKTWIDVFFLKK
ncbi:hypothetical protein [Paenibacillus odorifer]|uniref:hypothetical protein n=1 Tax=Paenibacillus odorifer TaxID=189426 RepID=UPI0015C3AB07|nr:hypothetical protein [Paenibacillus odorifer]